MGWIRIDIEPRYVIDAQLGRQSTGLTVRWHWTSLPPVISVVHPIATSACSCDLAPFEPEWVQTK
jgi:hypothetical protein